MLPESGLSAFIQTKCPLNSVPKWKLRVGSVLILLAVMFTFRVQFTFTNSIYFLALDFVSYQSKEKHSNFKPKQNLFNSEGNSREESL